jgi:Holliday junction resolvasome RuvABC endonuclease subunit
MHAKKPVMVYPSLVTNVSPKVLGVDPSTKTGIVLAECANGVMKTFVTKTIKMPGLTGVTRANAIAQELVSMLIGWPDLDLAVIEGYGFNNKFTLSLLTEIGTLLRHSLLSLGVPVLVMPPKSLKEYVTGHGNADKDAMMSAVDKRWGFKTKDDNQADAWGLAAAGGAYMGALPFSFKEREILSSLSFLPCLHPAKVP